jgi:SP family xylose:H+ symportor-like MFS transporter
MAVAVAAQWIANYLISSTFLILNNNPYLIKTFNHGFAYFVYGIMSILAAVFVWALVPETKNRSLEQMQHLWIKPGSASPDQ